MIKQLLTASLVVAVINTSLAQRLHIGVKTNLALTGISGKGMSGSWQTGYEAGAFAEVQLGAKWSLQPELLYSQRNFRRADDFGVYYVNLASSAARQTLKLGYLSLPLLVNYKISNMLYASAGPQYNYGIYTDENLLKSSRQAFKKSDLALVAGLQLNLSPSFRVYGRYQYGLLNVNNIDSRYRWSASQLTVGVGMHLF